MRYRICGSALTFCTVGFSVFAVSLAAAAQNPTDLPAGPGKQVLLTMCANCHQVNVVTAQRLTEKQWQAQVADMVSRGAVGSDSDIKLLTDYLAANFGKGSKPVETARTAAAATTEVPGASPSDVSFGPQPGVITTKSPETGVTFDRIVNADKEPQNWLTFGGSYRSLRHSQLHQITPENAKDLELKWVFQARWLDPYETTPLVNNGVLYTMQGDDVVALDATNGRLFWIYKYNPNREAGLCCGRISRGLAMSGNTLFMAGTDDHLVAIDATSGVPLWSTEVVKASSGYTMTVAPLAIKGKIIVGCAGGEYGIRGFVAAYDAVTGKQIWRFYTVAGPGDPGRVTWGGDSWKHGGGSIWNSGSYDPETNLTIWGVGNAGPDYNGDVRPGDNLYTSSLIALDADTGQLKWHYQANPHNEFDWDAVQMPLLADMNWQGKLRKVLLWANRNGFFYVLDRTNGKFLLGKPFVKQNWNMGFDADGRPIMTPKSKSSEEGTLIFPDNQGGTNWYSPSYSPHTGLFYVNARDNFSTSFVKGPAEYSEGGRYDGRGLRPVARGPIAVGGDEDKVTELVAIDPQTGESKWKFPLNTGVSLHTFDGWQTTAGAAGVLTTTSDVLFTGSREGNFYAIDARSGKSLWKAILGGPMIMNPMTYAVGGKQYVAVNAGNVLFVFGLRRSTGAKQ